MTEYLNETEVRKALSVLKEPGELFEIRIIRQNRKQPIVGYFNDADLMVRQLQQQDLRDSNVYIVLNNINPACEGRAAKDKFIQGDATSDNDIRRRDWILVDIDPVRPSGTSSTDEQVQKAKKKANDVYNFLKNQGFKMPVCGFSGNGCHLLYKVELKNSEHCKKVVESFLKTLSVMFSDEDVKVDTANFNASRVCKLYGTLAQKGSNIEKQPHRMSRMTRVPDVVQKTELAMLEKVCELMPETPDEPQQYNSYNSRDFDLDEWLTKYGIAFRTVGEQDGTKYILDHCPFDESHKGKDAMIFKRRNGAIGFHCFHDSCQGKTWKDVRMLFEPDAYEKREMFREKQMFGHFNRIKPIAKRESTLAADEPVFESAKYILGKPEPEETYIKTGIIKLDKAMIGLKKSAVTLMSGLRSSAKSTMLSQLVLNAVNDGNHVAVYSGELKDSNFMKWMFQQAAGRNHVERSKYNDKFYTPDKYKKQIAEWLDGKFWLYNNAYGHEYNAVVERFEKEITEKKLDFLVLDNLMTFDIRALSPDKFDAQKEFVLSLVELAKRYNVHVLFVAHPRKAMGFLRLQDVSGTNDLVNAVDNAIIVHRKNKDFLRMSKEMFQWGDDAEAYKGTNVIEVAKDRDNGTQDLFIPLWFEPESRRLRNSESEYVRYGWEIRQDGQATLPVQENRENSEIGDGFVPVGDENMVFEV